MGHWNPKRLRMEEDFFGKKDISNNWDIKDNEKSVETLFDWDILKESFPLRKSQ